MSLKSFFEVNFHQTQESHSCLLLVDTGLPPGSANIPFVLLQVEYAPEYFEL